MKKISYGIIAVLISFSAYAIKTGAFRSTNDMADAENVLIVRVPISYSETPPLIQQDDVQDYDVELLGILKGHSGKAGDIIRISTTQALSPGARYLLTGNGKPWLLFHWQLGVMRLPEKFNLLMLEGKNPKDKIAAILSARHAEVVLDIRTMEDEKKRIEEVLGKK